MQQGLLCGGEARTSAERQAAASPGLYAFAGARAAKRESRVMARGRSSSHATMRSILIAAAVATCCKWVLAKPQYRVRRSPKARTPCERVPSMPARCAYCALPSALAYQIRASATASASARGADRARRTRLRGKLDNDRATALAPAVLPPGRRQVPLGTAYLLLVPVHHKLLWAVRALDLGLPALARAGGTAQDNVLLVAAADEEFRADIRGIDEVLAWRHLLLDERLLNRLRTLRFMHRGRRRVDVREEVRGRGLTRLTDVDHVPGPRRVPLLAVARLDIVRGFDACGRGRQLAVLFESHLTHGRHLRGRRRLLCPLVVALPRPAQGLHVQQLAQPRGGFRGLQEVKEPEPILADRVGVRLACGRVLREARLLDPPARAL